MKIISIGEITIDRYLRQNLNFVGGISLNFAVQAKRSGADHVALVSCVGDGPNGRHVIDVLAQEQIDQSHLAVCEGKSAECAIEVYDNADRFFPDGGYKINVLSQLKLSEPIIDFIEQHDLLMSMFSGHHDETLTRQLVALPDFAGKIALDFGDWSGGKRNEGALEILPQIDLAFFSGDEETAGLLQPIAAETDCQIVVTLGAAGSVAFTAEGIVRQVAIPVKRAVDSTGCGDAFQAAFALSYFQDGDVALALAKGAQQAATVLQHYGAFSQTPFPSG